MENKNIIEQMINPKKKNNEKQKRKYVKKINYGVKFENRKVIVYFD